ncbi:MAG: hypothetical protein QNJ51_27270 [Calothrix sp. MO_167.B12]|nr:hypothetical protein [Calothrix sp. MO_167.B12]
MVLDGEKRAVGIFSSRLDTEIALQELKDSGFPMEQVSVIAKDAEREEDLAGVEVRESAENETGKNTVVGAIAGSTLGGITGLLVGLGTLAIPGIGPIMLAGAEAAGLVTAFAGGAIGAVTGGLIGLGIPEERAEFYSDLVADGYYLTIIKGSEADIRLAQIILGSRGIREWGVYGVPAFSGIHDEERIATLYYRGIGVFKKDKDAKAAIIDLRKAGFPMSQVSVIARDTTPYEILSPVDAVYYTNNYPRVETSTERTQYYQDRFNQGDALLILSGRDAEIQAAKKILTDRGVEDFGIYNLSKTQPVNNYYKLTSCTT